MNFCSECGKSLVVIQKQGNLQPLYHCTQCQQDYANHPKLLVACFISCGDKLLWMRRGLPPQAGHWAIPAGFMEEGETLREAAARELREETQVVIAPDKLELFMMGTISFISEVYIAFRAEVDCVDCGCGEEALDVGFFSREELDWSQVAYPQANNSIEQAYTDLERGSFSVYHAEMTPDINALIAIN